MKDATVRELVDYATDALSLPREAMAWAGDQLRVFRVRSALRALVRTRDLAEECGVKLAPPAMKFLAPFLEGASLEDEADSEFIDRWACLLLNASSLERGNHVYYASVLKQIQAAELDIIESIVRNSRRD